MVRLGIIGAAALVLGCVAPQAGDPVHATSEAAPVEPRIGVLDPAYGASAEHGKALAPGEPLLLDGPSHRSAGEDGPSHRSVGEDGPSHRSAGEDGLPLAEGGWFAFDEALGAGPVVLVWIGGAEHVALIEWVQALDRSLAQFDARGAALVLVRPLGYERAAAFARELGLRALVSADAEGELVRALRLGDAPLDFAVVVVEQSGTVVYRKLGGRPPQLDELLAVLDGQADALRCCPSTCGEPACERDASQAD